MESQNVSISHFHDYQKSTNICVYFKYYYFFLLNCWPTSGWSLKRQVNIFCDKQSRYFKNSENFLTKSSFEKTKYIYILTL